MGVGYKEREQAKIPFVTREIRICWNIFIGTRMCVPSFGDENRQSCRRKKSEKNQLSIVFICFYPRRVTTRWSLRTISTDEIQFFTFKRSLKSRVRWTSFEN